MVAMIREVVTVGTAAATVTYSGTHHVVLRVALATVTQVAVTAAVCYGAYLSPYAEGLKNRVKIVEDSPGVCQCVYSLSFYLKFWLHLILSGKDVNKIYKDGRLHYFLCFGLKCTIT